MLQMEFKISFSVWGFLEDAKPRKRAWKNAIRDKNSSAGCWNAVTRDNTEHWHVTQADTTAAGTRTSQNELKRLNEQNNGS